MINAVAKFFRLRETKTMGKILIVVALCLAAVACGGQPHMPIGDPIPRPTPTPAVQACTACAGVVFVGDSIFGRLVQEPLFQSAGYIDSGVFGQRTDEMLARFPQIVTGQNVCSGYIPPAGQPGDSDFPFVCQTLAQQPKEIVILAGWNNMFQGANSAYISEMASNIQSMVSMAQAKGIKVVVCTVYAYDPGHPAPWMQPIGSAPVTFYDMWRVPLNSSIGNIRGISAVDLSGLFAGQIDYTEDGVHPTFGIGNVQMLNAIEAKL